MRTAAVTVWRQKPKKQKMMTNRQQTWFLDVWNKEHDEQDNAYADAKENRNTSLEIDLDCGFTPDDALTIKKKIGQLRWLRDNWWPGMSGLGVSARVISKVG